MGRDGQSTVEFVLVLPLVLTVLLCALQVVVVVRHRVLLEQALHVAARTAALAEPGLARTEAAAAARAALEDTATTLAPAEAGLLRVTVVRRSRTDLPIVGRLLPDPVLRATTVVRVER